MIREAIQQLVGGQGLDADTAAEAMDDIMRGEATPAQMGAFLVALRMKGETADELVGLVRSMRRHATTIAAPEGAIDTCGTGGDSSGTFNISTAAALVARGAGAVVAKHGNRAATSRCGSADVFEALGYPLNLAPPQVQECVARAGIAFLFAPTFHPAMRHAGATRSEIGVRTAFNLLGPMANPALVRRQALGVGNAAAAARMAEVLAALGHERALVFHGSDGLDELTTTGESHIYDLRDGEVREYDIDPAKLGLSRVTVAELQGGDAATNAAIVRGVLAGEAGPARDIVLLNAAAALIVAGLAADFHQGLGVAAESVDSGKAREALANLVDVACDLAA